jgi:DNA-binding NarL/FixJ family response regulator
MPSRTITVLVADDHETVRRGLCDILAIRGDLAVCAQARDGQEAIDKALEMKPDLVVLDITMPRRDGFTAAREIRSLLPSVRILIFSMHDSVSFTQTAKRVGANGFVVKTDPSEVLLDAIDALMRGEDFFSGERTVSAQRSRKRQRPNVA